MYLKRFYRVYNILYDNIFVIVYLKILGWFGVVNIYFVIVIYK